MPRLTAPWWALLVSGCPLTPPEPSPEPTPFVPIAWPESPPALDAAPIRGFVEQRGIAHLHSHHSHDACDGEPQPGGIPDESCLQDLRDGLCASRIDIAFLSDHPTHAEEAAFDELLLLRGDDEPVMGLAGTPVANRMRCPDGFRPLLLPGVESDLMPLGLPAHVPSAYHAFSPEAVADVQAAGGLAWLAHTEGRTIDELRPLGLDGIEIYQLHANLDPDIREEFLGLGAFDYLDELRPFFFSDPDDPRVPPHPDLAPLAFLTPNEPSLVALETLGQDRRLGVTGGTDAHRNVFPSEGTDGDRLDSYRRMLRWFVTRMRVEEAGDAEAARDALRRGLSYVVIESLGTPLGFDFFAEGSQRTWEMGEEFDLSGAQRIVLSVPTLDPRSPRSATPPTVTGRIYTHDGSERVLLAEGGPGELVVDLAAPGVYRAEVWIDPTHLTPYLGDHAEAYIGRPYPWIWSGALFVR